jgi:hypothetical protein
MPAEANLEVSQPKPMTLLFEALGIALMTELHGVGLPAHPEDRDEGERWLDALPREYLADLLVAESEFFTHAVPYNRLDGAERVRPVAKRMLNRWLDQQLDGSR